MIDRLPSRRRALKWVGGYVLEGSALASLAACKQETRFDDLSPFERIQRLEDGNYPKVASFDKREELFKATVQAFCQQAPCSWENTAKTIVYSPANFRFPQEQSNNLYIVSDDRSSVIINTDRLNSNIARLRVPTKGKDPRVLFEKTVLLSALGYLTVSRESLDYEPSSIRFPGPGQSVLSLGRIEGWVFVGKRENGSDFRLDGARLAVAELLNHIVVASKTEYQTPNSNILDAANLMSEINRQAEISDEQFVRYAKGELPIADFLDRWARIKNPSNPYRKGAILALQSIALRASGFSRPTETREEIKRWLGLVPLFTKPQGTPL